MKPVFVLTIGDILGLIALGFFALVFIFAYLPMIIKSWWKQFTCKHDTTYKENHACDAYCSSCGKNLGFVGCLKKVDGKWQTDKRRSK